MKVRSVSTHLYAFKNDITGLIKIGISNNPKKRMRGLESATGCKLQELIAIKMNGTARPLENKVHEELKDHRQLGEWFDCSESLAINTIRRVAKSEGYRRTPHLMKSQWYQNAIARRSK